MREVRSRLGQVWESGGLAKIVYNSQRIAPSESDQGAKPYEEASHWTPVKTFSNSMRGRSKSLRKPRQTKNVSSKNTVVDQEMFNLGNPDGFSILAIPKSNKQRGGQRGLGKELLNCDGS